MNRSKALIPSACLAAAMVIASQLPVAAQGVVSEFETLLKESLDVRDEFTQKLSTVQDEASARAVSPDCKRTLRHNIDLLKKAFGLLETASSEDVDRMQGMLNEQFGPRIRQSQETVVQQWARIKELPDGAAALATLKSAIDPELREQESLRPGRPGSSPPSAGSAGRTPPEKGSWAFVFPLLMLVIIAACAGSLYTEGMWSNAVRLVNVIFAALLATNFWEPAARYMQEMAPSFTFYWDFLCLWGLFGIFLVIFRALTDTISRVKVRFLKLADQIGSAFFAVWIGYAMVCFTMFTLNTAPLSENFLFGAFRSGEANFYILSPDLQWAGFVQKMSAGPFARGLGDDEAAKYGTASAQGEKDLAVFDRNGDFVPKYAARRRALEQYIDEKSTSRVADSDVVKR